jgi:hypothetical protein
MRVAKILSIAVVSVATVIVIATAVIAFSAFAPSRIKGQQNFAPTASQQAISPVGDAIIYSQPSGSSSFLHRKNPSSGTNVRLTSALSGIESEPSFSHDGKLIVYSFANSPDSKSAVWIVNADGSNAHQVTSTDEDALHPAFSPDDSKVFYGASSRTGHNSPLVGPARHDWAVFSIPVHSNAIASGSLRTQITHVAFYDLHSLDVAADGITPGGTKVLISTTGYPIGSLFEEFNLGSTGMQSIFQPHVPGEPSVGPSFGEARFIHSGMDVLFLAATNTAGGNYDYNVYTMSDVTGGDLKQLTHLRGMTQELRVLTNGQAAFVNGGVPYVIDLGTQVVKPL